MAEDARSTEVSKPKRIYCNRCRGMTKHVRHGFHEYSTYSDSADDGHFWESTTATLWSCAGCDSPVLETAWTGDGHVDDNGQMHEYAYYPPRTASDHRPRIFKKIPKKLAVIYRQTIKAFNGRMNILCAAGLRTLIEGICADKHVKGTNLEKKIDALQPHLPKNIVDGLHGLRFMGNDAVHELKPPTDQDLRLAVEIAEDIMNFLYDLDYKASLMPKKTTCNSATV